MQGQGRQEKETTKDAPVLEFVMDLSINGCVCGSLDHPPALLHHGSGIYFACSELLHMAKVLEDEKAEIRDHRRKAYLAQQEGLRKRRRQKEKDLKKARAERSEQIQQHISSMSYAEQASMSVFGEPRYSGKRRHSTCPECGLIVAGLYNGRCPSCFTWFFLERDQ